MKKHPATNADIGAILREIALFLSVEDVAFKPQAYEHAADTVTALDEELAVTYGRCGTKCIDDLSGIGESIAKKIAELVTTGRLKYYDALKKKYPFDMLGFASIEDVGPKTALALYRHLRVKTLRDLERAAKAGKIRKIAGFGRKREDHILKGLGFLQTHAGRFRLHDALPIAESIVAKLSSIEGVAHCNVAGSVRRRQETIGDIDILVTTSKPKLVIAAFKTLSELQEVVEEGPTKLAVRYRFGINGDLRILKPDEYGSALVYFTGDKRHNVAIRERAIKMGMKLSEYGLFKGTKRVACKTEEDVYAKLKMDWVPPEMRTDTGEVEAAIAHELPDLIPYGSIRGDLQVQTDWTDGSASIEEMARAAKAAGLSYIAITDHTKSLAMANGLDEKRLIAQGKEIDKLNKKLKGFRILKSTECDIKKDGSLDLSDAALKTLDLVCVSVHSFFDLDEKTQTDRVIRAMSHPLVNVLFHPTGRIVNAREPFKLDLPRVIEAAKKYNVALEVNGSHRLDLNDRHVRMAVEAGAKLVIDSDAHRPEEYALLGYGVATARRGWAKKSDVLNAKTAAELLKILSA
ncbi:DNA polymerase/3'-5' exonuclease PolX [bacterium]|nr:DNA polymerase/3'-5' exonuclease PolX [bacterium]